MNKKTCEGLLSNICNNQLNQICNTLKEIYNTTLFSLEDQEVPDDVVHLLIGIVNFANNFIHNNSQTIPEGLHIIATIFLGTLSSFPDSLQTLKRNIIDFFESWWLLSCPGKEEFALQLMLHRIEIIASNKFSKADLKRVVKLKGCFKSIALNNVANDEVNQLVELIKRCICSPFLINYDEGKQITSIFLGLDMNLTKDLHRMIKMKLSAFSRLHCEIYGEIYYKAWNMAEGEIQKVLENYCIQDLMYHAVHANREGKHSAFQKLKTILDYFHFKKNVSHINKLLFSLYQPILWRSLKVPNLNVRANAACIFFEAFPFENDDIKNSKLVLQKQFDLMQDLLFDPSPTVRVIAIIGVCSVCKNYWMIFPTNVLFILLSKLMDDLANDGSAWQVRNAVFTGLKILLDNPLSWRFLQKSLPKLKNNFHDVVESVRVAYLELLLKLKDIKEFQFWNIVPLDHLLSRLTVDSPSVAKRIVKLLLSSYLPADKSDYVLLERCIHLIRTSRSASRRFYFYAHQLMDVNKAVSFMLILLQSLKGYSIKKLQEKQTDYSYSVDDDDDEENENGNLCSSNPLNDPEIQAALFDIIAIMWTGMEHLIREPENEEHMEKLKKKFKSCMIYFFRYFKDTPSWNSLLYIATFVPSSTAKFYSKYCLSKLRTWTNDQPDFQIIAKCLCRWTLIDDMMEIISNWLTAGLKMGRNSSGKRSKKGKCVKFQEPYDPQPVVACDIIAWMLSDPICRKILIENRNQFSYVKTQLWTIMKVIENHLKTKSNTNIHCTEDFLKKAFLVLCRTNALLCGDDERETAVENFQQIIIWSCQEIVPLMKGTELSPVGKHSFEATYSDDEQTLCEDIIETVLVTTHDMALIGMINKRMCFCLVDLMRTTLEADEDCSFLLISTKILYQIIEYILSLEDIKDSDSYSTVISNMFRSILSSLTKKYQENKQIGDKIKPVLMEIFKDVFENRNFNSKITKDVISTVTPALISDFAMAINK